MKIKLRVLTCMLAAIPCVAEAYIGPGIGISAIGSFLAVLGATVLAVVGFIWFPLKRRFFRKKVDPEVDPNGALAETITGVQADDTGGNAGRNTPRG